MEIIKADGIPVQYDPEKIIHSLQRAKASPEIIRQVLNATEKEIYDGMTTKAVYQSVFRNLKKLNRISAGKYHLKKAIMELGPTGFPFERFIAALFEAEGYHTRTDIIIRGHCVGHEIDVLAKKDHQYLMMECKFHGNSGNICDVKHALYVYARFLDLEAIWAKKAELAHKHRQPWLVTNTRFSGDAERYGRCMGMGLLSWNYPSRQSLRERIDNHGLYPITCLLSLSKPDQLYLLEHGVVLCQHLCDNEKLINKAPWSDAKKQKIYEEAQTICSLRKR